MKKVLITGTGGFIYSNFVRKSVYEKQPYTFVSIDKVTKTNVLNNIYANKNHKFYIGDVADQHFINVVMELERPDIVLHGAAHTHVDDSILDPNEFIRSNVLGTQTLLNSCVRWKVEKFIYQSTDEVYGHLTDDSQKSWDETAPLNPRNPYAASKAAAELLIQAAYHTYGLPYNIIRSSNNYGPRQSVDKLIPKIIKCIINNEKIPIYGKGSQVRSWIHVQDNCAAVQFIMNNGFENEIYNVGTNQELSNIELLHLLSKVMDKDYTDLLTFVPDRAGHDFRYSLDCNKLKSLGWEPTIKLRRGLEITVEWYRNNLWFLRL